MSHAANEYSTGKAERKRNIPAASENLKNISGIARFVLNPEKILVELPVLFLFLKKY